MIEIVYAYKTNILEFFNEKKQVFNYLIPLGKAGYYYYPEEAKEFTFLYQNYQKAFPMLNGGEYYVTTTPIGYLVLTGIFISTIEEEINTSQILFWQILKNILSFETNPIIIDYKLFKKFLSSPRYILSKETNKLEPSYKDLDKYGEMESFEIMLEQLIKESNIKNDFYILDYTEYEID